MNGIILRFCKDIYISLEGLTLKLKLQYFGHLIRRLTHWKRPWCWERLKTGGEGDDRGWESWMASLTWWTWVWVSSWSWWIGTSGVLQSMGSQSRIRLSNWTELNLPIICGLIKDSWVLLSVSASICYAITHRIASGKLLYIFEKWE